MRIFVFLIGILTAISVSAQQKNDAASQQALKQTQDLLKDPKQFEKAAKENEKAKAAHDYATKVTGGGANLNEMYGISSEIFGYLISKYGSDSKKLQEVMTEAQTNPEKFYESLPKELKDKVRGLASKVPGSHSSPH